MRRRLLIVGGSYAACELASSARENGYGEQIVIVSDESELPYHRPPLSKAFLKGEVENALAIKADAFYTSNHIDVELGVRVVGIEREGKQAVLSNGARVSFDTLALAVGARARSLPLAGADLGNVHYLRSASDARTLRAAAASAVNIVIIGAGFIGLEVASALATPERRITVVEAADRILARAVAPETSGFLAAAHARHGVKLSVAGEIESLAGEKGVVQRVVLKDGRVIDADIVIVGIGSIPNTELAEQIGLRCRNGIVVDSQSRTDIADVFAMGDCAVFGGVFNTNGARLESVQNAIDQSRVAGSTIAGGDKHYESLPWFWSDQYDLKLQMAGLASGATDRVVRHGSDSEMSVFHFRDDVCISVESVNRPREHMSARRLLPAGVTRARLQEVDFDIAALMKR
ncbi:NAD(P)/FAD-dependent oxidoreductase [Burkholderia cenocepacia]|uniref:NAD(P)/FAD-dependent oxidoreductase n=1 Tax=Burkholderia cenocepacia TaxID=95486 RepID=UPI00406D0B56